MTLEYSSTIPLMAVAVLGTLIYLAEKMEGIFPAPAPSPVVLGTLTLEMAAVAIRISPREDKFLPLPAMTYLVSMLFALTAYALRDRELSAIVLCLPWIILKSLSAVASTRAEISNSIDFLAAARLRRARCAMRLARASPS